MNQPDPGPDSRRRIVQPMNNPTSATTAFGTPPSVQLRWTHCGIDPPASEVVAIVHSMDREGGCVSAVAEPEPGPGEDKSVTRSMLA